MEVEGGGEREGWLGTAMSTKSTPDSGDRFCWASAVFPPLDIYHRLQLCATLLPRIYIYIYICTSPFPLFFGLFYTQLQWYHQNPAGSDRTLWINRSMLDYFDLKFDHTVWSLLLLTALSVYMCTYYVCVKPSRIKVLIVFSSLFKIEIARNPNEIEIKFMLLEIYRNFVYLYTFFHFD